MAMGCGICFYLDTMDFIHKPNPMEQVKALKRLVWKKKNEDLIKDYTSKLNKAVHGGKVTSFFVTILLCKGVYYCKHYEKLSGELFVEFIENNLVEIFKSSCNPTGNALVQHGDPSQNFKAAKTALDKIAAIGAVQFSIPLCSPDVNPIENAFNLVEKKLISDAVKYSISKENYVERVENTLLSYPIEPIDNIIKSMPKRTSQVMQSKSHRLKH